jgi:thiamine biosynthesis lipoprotein
MKKRFLLLTIATLMLCGCQSTTEISNNTSDSTLDAQITQGSGSDPSTADLFAMDTYMSIKAYGDNSADVLKDCCAEITNLEKLFSVTDENSDISQINNSSGDFVAVSDDTKNIISTALDISEKTSGALDITMYPILSEWGFTTGDYKVPSEQKITSLLENTGYYNIEISGNQVKIPENYKIDLGSVAKGYTSDKVRDILKNADISSAIINLGGNVYALGRKTDDSLWTVGIVDPFDETQNVCSIKVENKAVITSGNYERYFTDDDGNTYWHIIDPKTGSPADNGIVSATIVGDNGVICDALSTALFVLGTDDAIDYWQAHSDEFEMILVTDESEVYVSEGLTDTFDLLCDMQVNIVEKE